MAKKNSKTKSTEPPKGLLMQVPVANIRTTGTNPRKQFNEQDIEELALSIKTIGLLQPIVCMKADDDFIFTLICGERRYRAALLAGIDSIPGIVYDPLPDDVVFEMQITENLQRKDINPMEESNAFAELVKRGLKTPEQIADKLGVSIKYVYDRLALQRVIPAVQENILKGTISISHGKQFARLQPKDQEALWDNLFLGDNDDNGIPQVHEEVTISRMRSSIQDSFSRKLSDAIFSITDPQLNKKAGACTKCPKRSGCNQLLFDDITQEDICFDKSCYDKKVEAHLEQLEEVLISEGKKVVKISAAWMPKDKEAIGRSDWDEVKEGKPCDAYGIVVEAYYNPQYPIGKVVPVALKIEEEEEEETLAPGMPGDNRNTNKKQEVIDWEGKLLKRLEEQVVDFFICNPTNKDRSVLIEEFVRAFDRLSDEAATLVAGKMEWDLVKNDSPYTPYDLEKTALNALRKTDYSNGDLIDLTHFFQVLGRCGDETIFYDFEDFEKVNVSLFKMGINLREEVKVINEQAGHEAVEIPEPEAENEDEEEEEEAEAETETE